MCVCIYIYIYIYVCVYIYIYTIWYRYGQIDRQIERQIWTYIYIWLLTTYVRNRSTGYNPVCVPPTSGCIAFSLYKILSHFKDLLWVSIILVLPPPICKAYPIAIPQHDHCAIHARPPTPSLFAIHHTQLVMAISCKGQHSMQVFSCTYRWTDTSLWIDINVAMYINIYVLTTHERSRFTWSAFPTRCSTSSGRYF